MKNLPESGGCSCIWNYYQAQGDYTEIDIEMPANGKASGADWSRWAGLNTYYPDETKINERHQDLGGPQNDGNFHIYRWDWFDGTNGPPRVDFYLDGKFLFSSTKNVRGCRHNYGSATGLLPGRAISSMRVSISLSIGLKITEIRSAAPPGRESNTR